MQLDATTIMKTLDPIYDKAISGVQNVPGMDSSKELAEDYLNDPGTLETKVNGLINNQVIKASTSGFVTGLGGIITLPVAIPANLASVMYIQLQMITAIAHMGGHDVRSDRVKTLCYVCLCGDAATDILKTAGVTIGKKLTERAITKLSFETIKKINQAVGFRLVTKFGQMGAVNLGKAVPLAGGVVGGIFDGSTTYAIGKIAQSTFLPETETSSGLHSGYEDEPDIIESISKFLFPGDDERNSKDTL